MGDARIVGPIWLRTNWHRGLMVSVSLEPEDEGRFQGGHLLQNVFSFFFFLAL